jgi:hypothetical protein
MLPHLESPRNPGDVETLERFSLMAKLQHYKKVSVSNDEAQQILESAQQEWQITLDSCQPSQSRIERLGIPQW